MGRQSLCRRRAAADNTQALHGRIEHYNANVFHSIFRPRASWRTDGTRDADTTYLNQAVMRSLTNERVASG
jgi:hypothetical protein